MSGTRPIIEPRDVILLPAYPDSEIALIGIAIDRPKFRVALESDTEERDFSRPFLGKLRRLFLARAREGGPLGISDLEKAWPTCEDPPAAVQGVFDDLRKIITCADHWGWHLKRVREASANRRLFDTGERITKLALDGGEPAEFKELTKRLYPDIAILEGADTRSVEPLPLMDLSIPPPPVPEPLVGDERQQLLMPREATVFASDPGIGKTKLLTEIAEGIASGIGALGFIARPQPVLYVTSDGDPEFLRNVHRQWAGRKHPSLSLASLPLRVWSDNDFNLEDPVWHERMVKTLKVMGAENDPVTLFIESLATNVLETNLNDQVAVRQYVRKCVRSLMARFSELTFGMSCHLRKPQSQGANDLGSRVAGSVQIRGAFDCVIALVPSGKDAFTVRRIKRSRSGGDFEAFRVQILGSRTDPLVLRNEGPVEIGTEELRGAAKVIMAYMRTAGPEPQDTDTIASHVPGFQKRAIQGACKKLSEAEKPLLTRVSNKPAKYVLAPDQGDLGLGGLD